MKDGDPWRITAMIVNNVGIGPRSFSARLEVEKSCRVEDAAELTADLLNSGDREELE
jgi:hypothetical protein